MFHRKEKRINWLGVTENGLCEQGQKYRPLQDKKDFQSIVDIPKDMSEKERTDLEMEAARVAYVMTGSARNGTLENMNMYKEEAKENAIGLLVNYYYGKEEEFLEEDGLVGQLLKNLRALSYPLDYKTLQELHPDKEFGTRGQGMYETNIGDTIVPVLGTISKTAIGNFEIDYADEIKDFAEKKQASREAALKARQL